MLVSFTHPQYLFLLVLLPLVLVLHFFLLKVKRNDAVRFANFEAIARIRGVDLYSKNIVVVSVTAVTLVLLVFCISGMVVQRDVVSSAHSFVIAIDASQSMAANDFYPSRIDAAKNTAKNFIELAPSGTKVAIVSFSGSTFIEQELTEDKSLAIQGLENIETSTIGGTDPAEAIISSTNLLALEDGKSVILLSDGRINVGNIDKALDYAVTNDVIIHTIGLGTEEGGELDYGGTVVISTIEEESLMSAAYITGGTYNRATSEETLGQAFSGILKYRIKRVTFDATQYLLIAALVLIMVQYVLTNTRYKTLP